MSSLFYAQDCHNSGRQPEEKPAQQSCGKNARRVQNALVFLEWSRYKK
jgi:hypothetical protein